MRDLRLYMPAVAMYRKTQLTTQLTNQLTNQRKKSIHFTCKIKILLAYLVANVIHKPPR